MREKKDTSAPFDVASRRDDLVVRHQQLSAQRQQTFQTLQAIDVELVKLEGAIALANEISPPQPPRNRAERRRAKGSPKA